MCYACGVDNLSVYLTVHISLATVLYLVAYDSHWGVMYGRFSKLGVVDGKVGAGVWVVFPE